MEIREGGEMETLTTSDTQTQTFEANLGLATWVAMRFGHSVLPSLDDRIQAARIGLWKAVLHHDPVKSKLTTFAVRVMLNEIVRVGRREHAIDALPIETVMHAVQDAALNPEQQILLREAQEPLSRFAGQVTRKRIYRGATWTASDVAAMIDAGKRPVEVARILGVSRERIRQVLKAIRAERTKQEEGGK
jgi:RNA polymerase sigma factor (sigma-70 family)